MAIQFEHLHAIGQSFVESEQGVLDGFARASSMGDVPRDIRDTNYDNLPVINSSVQLYYDTKTTITSDSSAKSRELLRIPLLKDVFERYPTTPINIDIKENNDELIKQVSELIQHYRREHLTYWGSFSHAVCRKLSIQNPRIVRFCSLREAAGIVFSYWFGLLPFLPLTPGAFEVPIPGEVFGKTTENLDWKFKTLFYLAERALNNRSMFTHLQRRGIPVYVWILNNDQEFDYAFKQMGVTGVMTDYPTRLQKYLSSNRLDFLL